MNKENTLENVLSLLNPKTKDEVQSQLSVLPLKLYVGKLYTPQEYYNRGSGPFNYRYFIYQLKLGGTIVGEILEDRCFGCPEFGVRSEYNQPAIIEISKIIKSIAHTDFHVENGRMIWNKPDYDLSPERHKETAETKHNFGDEVPIFEVPLLPNLIKEIKYYLSEGHE